MHGLHESQQKILEFLLEHHGASLDDLAAHLGVTRTAVQAHVVRLLDLGFLAFEDVKSGVGRPRRRYLVTEEGLDAFPKKYSWLTNAILAQLAGQLGPKGSSQFMRGLAESVAASLGSPIREGDSPVVRAKQATALMNELGYRAALKPSLPGRGPVIEAVNCVYHSVAKEHPELCQFDVSLLERVSGMEVRLETCIARGGPSCRFQFTKKD